MKSTSKKIIKHNSQSTQYWKMKLKNEHKKSPKSTKQTCDMGHESKKTTQNTHWNKLWSLIINQPNIEKQSTKKRKKKTSRLV